MRVAVLASGGGSNFQALLDFRASARLPAARAELLVASRAGIGALERAAAAGVATYIQQSAIPEEAAAELLRVFRKHEIELVVLAGYLRLLPRQVLAEFPRRVLNIHPALLPAFGGHGMYGRRVHEAVIRAGVRVSGATVHEVAEEYDTGRILAQWPVPVFAGDTAANLAARVLRVEHLLLPAVVDQLARQEKIAGTVATGSFRLDAEHSPGHDEIRAFIRVD